MIIDTDQIVNLPRSDLEPIINENVEAQADLANCTAALLAAEQSVRLWRKRFVGVAWTAGFWAVIAVWLLLKAVGA